MNNHPIISLIVVLRRLQTPFASGKDKILNESAYKGCCLEQHRLEQQAENSIAGILGIEDID
ncbi:MAG: hypothetical protein CTY34_00265 [Methylobacter sp.]|nr:MAG: hypothetical protein CTY34_00265 [Methylobacter sp.]PPD18366.1 MAG: hypothetical protein CTY24_13150 [Methylobacter sp.]PPD31982.1 MAG: hypothetical protein CTY18_11655 [Methylomonas sp.]